MHPTARLIEKKASTTNCQDDYFCPDDASVSLTPFPREWILHSAVLMTFDLKLAFSSKNNFELNSYNYI